MAVKDKILVIGASGQIGTDLVLQLRENFGSENVVASDIKNAADEVKEGGPFELLDILDRQGLIDLVNKYRINQVYLLAALLSATAEQKVNAAWNLNMNGLLNVLDLARDGVLSKVFWPSSIAVFGPTTPKDNTPQVTITEPNTVYGISKLAGERWCEYYNRKFNVDVRSIRYPGLIGYKSAPGGGTTDYAVNIFHEALEKGTYTCFLSENTTLPMMYMPDAIRGTIGLMDAESAKLTVRSSYNISGMSFNPVELAEEIKNHVPGFTCSYDPDSRQQIADSWPRSIDDNKARVDWQWSPIFNLANMTEDMFKHLRVIKTVV